MTYSETIKRFRVLKHEELPETHKAAIRARGEDPDHRWTLYASADTREIAEQIAEDSREMDRDIMAEIGHPGESFTTYKVVDHGTEETIERPIY